MAQNHAKNCETNETRGDCPVVTKAGDRVRNTEGSTTSESRVNVGSPRRFGKGGKHANTSEEPSWSIFTV